MWNRNAARLLVLAFVSVLFDPGCAALFQEPEQKIPVTSSPAGATVFLDGVEQGATPIAIQPLRRKKGQTIRIEAPGYNPLEIRLKRRRSPFPVLGAILVGAIGGGCYWLLNDLENGLDCKPVTAFVFGAVIGAGAGLTSTSGYTLRPTDLAVTLTKADGTPRVDTIFIDSDELRNVKWIRVLGCARSNPGARRSAGANNTGS